MKIEEVKTFLEQFALAEAHAYDVQRQPGFEIANEAKRVMYSYTLGLINQMGIVLKTKDESAEYYERVKNAPLTASRFLYKISHYKHKEYDNVWIAYLSGINPSERAKLISYAFFIIQVEGELKIAKVYIYSNNEGMDIEYNWEEMEGERDLTFESLGALVCIERYLEPSDKIDSLKLYNEEK